MKKWLFVIPAVWSLTGMLVIASQHRKWEREDKSPVGIETYLAGAFFGPLLLTLLFED